MNLLLPPRRAAEVLGVGERTVRNRIRSGAITNVVGNGRSDRGARHLIDMTREYGITKEDYDAWKEKGGAA